MTTTTTNLLERTPMQQMALQEIDAFLASRSHEPSWFAAWRKGCLKHMLDWKSAPHRYGLNIHVAPSQALFTGVQPQMLTTTGPRSMAFDPAQGVTIYPWSFQKPESMPVSVVERVRAVLARAVHDSELMYAHAVALLGFATDVIVVAIAPDANVIAPITLDWLVKRHQFSLIIVLAGKNSKASLLLQTTADEQCPTSTHVGRSIIVDADAGSTVAVTSLESLPANVLCVRQQVAFVAQDARVDWIGLSKTAGYVRDHYGSQLVGSRSQSSIAIAATGIDNGRIDLSTSAFHRGTESVSNIVTKLLVAGVAKGVSRGLISIGADAGKSSGFEKQDALLTTPTAEADAIPNLEIHNHDVKCSHGSTVGEIDGDALFYLQSRGIPEEEARRLLLAGFVGSVIDMIKHPILREETAKRLGAFLP